MLNRTENQRLPNSNSECHLPGTSSTSSITTNPSCATITTHQPQPSSSRSPALQQPCPSRSKMGSRFLSNRCSILPLAVLSLVVFCLQQPAVVQSRSIASSLISTNQHLAALHAEDSNQARGLGIQHTGR